MRMVSAGRDLKIFNQGEAFSPAREGGLLFHHHGIRSDRYSGTGTKTRKNKDAKGQEMGRKEAPSSPLR